MFQSPLAIGRKKDNIVSLLSLKKKQIISLFAILFDIEGGWLDKEIL
jgi:hypothetical protein